MYTFLNSPSNDFFFEFINWLLFVECFFFVVSDISIVKLISQLLSQQLNIFNLQDSKKKCLLPTQSYLTAISSTPCLPLFFFRLKSDCTFFDDYFLYKKSSSCVCVCLSSQLQKKSFFVHQDNAFEKPWRTVSTVRNLRHNPKIVFLVQQTIFESKVSIEEFSFHPKYNSEIKI